MEIDSWRSITTYLLATMPWVRHNVYRFVCPAHCCTYSKSSDNSRKLGANSSTVSSCTQPHSHLCDELLWWYYETKVESVSQFLDIKGIACRPTTSYNPLLQWNYMEGHNYMALRCYSDCLWSCGMLSCTHAQHSVCSSSIVVDDYDCDATLNAVQFLGDRL